MTGGPRPGSAVLQSPNTPPESPFRVLVSGRSRLSSLERVRRFRQSLREGICGIAQTRFFPPGSQIQAQLDPTEILRTVWNRISTSSAPLFMSVNWISFMSDEDLPPDGRIPHFKT